jgi:hypothetical protein
MVFIALTLLSSCEYPNRLCGSNHFFTLYSIKSQIRHLKSQISPYLCTPLKAHVVKLADTSDLGSDAARYGGSSPSMGTVSS